MRFRSSSLKRAKLFASFFKILSVQMAAHRSGWEFSVGGQRNRLSGRWGFGFIWLGVTKIHQSYLLLSVLAGRVIFAFR